MSSLLSFLFVLQVVVSILIIFFVILQQSDGDSLSGISASNGNAQMMSKRSTTTPMSKITLILFIIFMCNSLLLATFSARNYGKNELSTIEKLVEEKNKNEKNTENTESIENKKITEDIKK